jgi:hypothetical protein
MFARIFGVGGAVLTAGLFLGGCAADNQAGHDRHAAVMGMTCPKCETTWIGPHGKGSAGRVQALHWGREEVCPDCDAMAQAYFKDGETVLHNCPMCNVTPRPATQYTPTHPKGTHG